MTTSILTRRERRQFVTGIGTFDPRLTGLGFPQRARSQPRRLVAAKPVSPSPISVGFAHIPRPRIEAQLGERVKRVNNIDTPDAQKKPPGMSSQIDYFGQESDLEADRKIG